MCVTGTLMHGATANVVLVFGQIGQVAEIGEGADHAHGLFAAERGQQFFQGFTGLSVCVASKHDREPANLLHQGVSARAFLLAQYVAQNATEQADVIDQWPLGVCTVTR